MKILVTGGRGLVGRAVVEHCLQAGDQVVALGHSDLDITDERAVDSTLDRLQPEVVINCAAWTDVDGCELDPARAQAANGLGPELLASACRRLRSLLVTISTDYVFAGDKEGFYTQRDQPHPISAYGVSKLAGERRAQAAWARTIIVRSGYLFGHAGKNYLSRMVALGRRGETLRVINDSFGTPTYAPHLAQRLYQLARMDLPGIYHVVNSGHGASFEDFARAAFGIAKLDVDLLESVHTSELRRPAPRPRNSRLKCLLSEAIGLSPLPFWKDAVREFVLQSGN